MGIVMRFRQGLGRFVILIVGALFFSACSESSQKQFATPAAYTETQSAMSKLTFLVGNWAGPGISYLADGTQTKYHDTEFVRFDLDKNLLLINARGEGPDGATTYSLHTVIHYNTETQKYIYTPYSGKSTPRSFDCILNDRAQFICLIPDQSYRLTFQRLPDGRWNEFGERLIEGAWVKNFETILSAQ